MSKKIRNIVIIVVAIILITIVIMYLIDLNRMKNNESVLFSTWGRKYAPPISIEEKEQTQSKINIVLSLEDKIQDNTAWCGTINLIWNDLKNNLAKQDIIFTPQSGIVENLNKGTFTVENLSEDSYYKIYGFPNLELKKQIEKEIKEKFNETSDILDDFVWENHNPKDYFLYAMLKKDFEFPKIFTEFENSEFRNYENVKYFGINEKTEDEVKNQVQVLYYNSIEDFAIKLITKTNDEVIISKGNNQETFKEIYNNIIQESENYEGNHNFTKNDILKIPNISFDIKKELQELQNKPFLFSNGDEYEIEKALQVIQFDLDKKGGKIKSEAGMMANKSAVKIPDEIREFLVDDTFTIFLNEKGKTLPYFAAKISDISKVQNDVKKSNDTKEISEEEEEKVSKLSQMYIDMIDYLMEKDSGLQSDIKFIAIDFSNFRRPLTESEKAEKYNLPNFNTKEEEEEWKVKIKSKPIEEETKQEILKYLKEKYPNIEIKQNTFKELLDQGLAIKNEGIKDGIIISVEKIPEIIEENKAQINLAKYRAPLGAYFIRYEMKYENNKWQLKSISEAIS